MAISYNGDAQGTLAQVSDLDQKEYDTVYRPLNQAMIASTNSTAMVDSAKNNADGYFDNATSRQGRMSERYGLNLSALETDENNRRTTAKKGLNYDQTVNTSRMEQYERNNKVRNDMVSVGRGIEKSAYAQMTQAASLENQRQNANAQAAAANDSAQSQLIGGLVSSALMAFAIF